jgi:hypothetical protein
MHPGIQGLICLDKLIRQIAYHCLFLDHGWFFDLSVEPAGAYPVLGVKPGCTINISGRPFYVVKPSNFSLLIECCLDETLNLLTKVLSVLQKPHTGTSSGTFMS